MRLRLKKEWRGRKTRSISLSSCLVRRDGCREGLYSLLDCLTATIHTRGFSFAPRFASGDLLVRVCVALSTRPLCSWRSSVLSLTRSLLPPRSSKDQPIRCEEQFKMPKAVKKVRGEGINTKLALVMKSGKVCSSSSSSSPSCE